jgi:hypothetical protein
MGLTSSHHFLSIHVTPYNTGKSSRISPNRFFCVGLRQPHNVAICFETTYDAKNSFRDVHIPCDLHSSLCTLRLTFVHVCLSRNH